MVQASSTFHPTNGYTNGHSNGNSNGQAAEESILFVSSMDAARDDSFQHTLAELKGSTGKQVRAEMLDRILDGAAILPPSTYQRFVVLLPQDTVQDSIRALLPSITPSLTVYSASTGSTAAKVQVKSVAAAENASTSGQGQSVAQGVLAVLQGAGYREARIEGDDVFATAPARVAALPLRRKKDSNATAAKKALWSFTTAPSSGASTNGTSTPTIDESTLLTADDLKRATAVQRPDCDVKKTRKACKNCTCGLRELLLEEKDDLPTSITSNPAGNVLNGRAKSGIDRQLANGDRRSDVTVVSTGAVTSSCGSCYLGDAFRCASCPYLGLPAFEPGQKVEIPAGMLDDDV